MRSTPATYKRISSDRRKIDPPKKKKKHSYHVWKRGHRSRKHQAKRVALMVVICQTVGPNELFSNTLMCAT